jgi:hypothetical protein
MALMVMVEMAADEVVRMIAVGNRFMPAARTVTVSGFVAAAGVSSSAFRGIPGIHFQLVFVDMIAMHIVHVAIVEETLVPMLMRVSFMNVMTHVLLLRSVRCQNSRSGRKNCDRKW